MDAFGYSTDYREVEATILSLVEAGELDLALDLREAYEKGTMSLDQLRVLRGRSSWNTGTSPPRNRGNINLGGGARY